MQLAIMTTQSLWHIVMKKVKNKIIKWLGGYTQDELLEKKKIEFYRTEKQFYPITAEFAIDAQYKELEPGVLEFVKHNLCYQVAEFMFKYNLLYYDVSRNETNDCYIVRAKTYVREL